MEGNLDGNSSGENTENQNDSFQDDQNIKNQSSGMNSDYGSNENMGMNSSYSSNQDNGQNYGDPQYQNFGNPQYQNYGQNQYYSNPQYQNVNGKMKKVGGSGFAIASLVLGIISLCLFCSCFNFITAILSIIFGCVYLTSYVLEHKNMAIAGIATSVISIILFFVAWGLIITSDSMQTIMEEQRTNNSTSPDETYKLFMKEYNDFLQKNGYDLDEEGLEDF